MIFALEKYLDQPHLSLPGSKKLSEEMSILVSVCKTSQFDWAELIGLSYKNFGAFYKGQINDTNFLSWSGHYGNMTYNETLNTLLSSGVEHIHFDQNIEALEIKLLLPHGVCKLFRGNTGMKSMLIYIGERSDYTVTVTDPAAAVNFRLADHMMTGDIIMVKTDLASKVVVNYLIQLTETSIETGDGSCTDYPNEQYETYADCVEKELENKILPVLGCMVPWISRNKMCSGLIPKLQMHNDLTDMLYSFIISSLTGQAHHYDNCRPPCKKLSAHSKYLSTRVSQSSNDRIYINFDENIKVERIVLAYGLDTFLVEIGSALGLWLGLSVIGVFDVLVTPFIKLQLLLQKR